MAGQPVIPLGNKPPGKSPTPVSYTHLKLIEILNRPQVTIENIAEHVPAFQRELEKATSANQDRKEEILEAAEILIKYQGYIDRERMIAEKDVYKRQLEALL